MKETIFILSVIFICSCQSNSDAIWPENLDDKKTLLKEKQKNLRQISSDIEKLTAEIETLDPSAKKQMKLVSTDSISLIDFKRYSTLQGNIMSDDFVNVSSEIGGRILNIFVKEGQSVRKGQLIAKIDLESIKKQIAELQLSLDLANTVYERQERLWKQNIGSEIQYLQAKNSKERIEKSLETIQFQLSKENVYSPISGVVEREVRQSGEMTSPGGPIVQILNTNKVKIIVDAPESYLNIVKRGDKVDLRIPTLDKEFSGRISLLGRMIDPANRTFKIEVNLPNSNGALKPNLLAEMLINDVTVEDAIVIPLELVQQEVGGLEFVFIVGSNDKNESIAQKAYVETGESYEGNIIITKGITTDQTIITEGARNIVDKELIKVINNG